jgi:ribonuclease HII
MITVGLDEVGRGCWAGPLVAGSVILEQPIKGLRDSKKLSAKRRQSLSDEITLLAADKALGWVWPAEIDEIGLTAAVRLAMQRSLEALTLEYDELIIDGNINFFPEYSRARAVIKADDSIPAVSAASIIAKVARDNWMAAAAERFPEYGFDKHVGYGTAVHIAALKAHGVCELHRLSYKPIKSIMAV